MHLTITLFVLMFLVASCSDQMGSKGDKNSCISRQSLHHYIVLKKSGGIEKVYIDNLGQYLNRNYKNIKSIEPDYHLPKRQNPNKGLKALRLSNARSNKLLWGKIGLYKYYNKGYFGQGIVVAVLDTGVYEESPYLRNRLSYNVNESDNGEDDDGNGYIDDVLGWNFYSNNKSQSDEVNHGTQIAHLIAANSGSPFGHGVAPSAKILPIDIMGAGGGSEADAILAIDYAIARGARIINNSWSVACSFALRDKYSSWLSNDILMVHAAGNDGRTIKSESSNSSNFKAANYISVGSLDDDGYRAAFSNYGPNIDLYTFGEDLHISGPFWMRSGDVKSLGSGTSYSAAIVSGVAALIWSMHPGWTATEVKQEILRTSIPIEGAHLLKL